MTPFPSAPPLEIGHWNFYPSTDRIKKPPKIKKNKPDFDLGYFSSILSLFVIYHEKELF